VAKLFVLEQKLLTAFVVLYELYEFYDLWNYRNFTFYYRTVCRRCGYRKTSNRSPRLLLEQVT